MKNRKYVFTSESVTEGHPDKVADQISDAILDAMLKDDPNSRVAVETLVTTGLCIVAGEVTTSTYVDLPEVIRSTIRDIGFLRSRAVIIPFGVRSNIFSTILEISSSGMSPVSNVFTIRETGLATPIA